MAYMGRLTDVQVAIYACIGEILTQRYARRKPEQKEAVEIFSPHVVEGYERPTIAAAKHVIQTLWEAVHAGIKRTYNTSEVPDAVKDIVTRVKELNPKFFAELDLES